MRKAPQLAWITIYHVPNIPGWDEEEQVNKNDVLQCSDAHVHPPSAIGRSSLANEKTAQGPWLSPRKGHMHREHQKRYRESAYRKV